MTCPLLTDGHWADVDAIMLVSALHRGPEDNIMTRSAWTIQEIRLATHIEMNSSTNASLSRCSDEFFGDQDGIHASYGSRNGFTMEGA